MMPILQSTVEVLVVIVISILTLVPVFKESTRNHFIGSGWQKLVSVSWND
jgi:hypothetical protein